MHSKSGSVKNIGCLVVLIIAGAAIFGIVSIIKDDMPSDAQVAASREQTETIIQTRIPKSIVEMDEIDWVEYDGNTVYVGFNTWPSDIESMLNAWAIQANQALDRGVHIIAALNVEKGWRPGQSAERSIQITARGGEIR